MAIFFGPIVWNPNQYAFVISGDGYYIIHQMAFHAKYGEGLRLASMNYPHYELIFLTDAQGMISVVASWIRHYIIDISPYIGGINNGLLLYTIPIGAILLWLTFREFKVTNIIALPFALLITFLSPQINRITTGHFGIGYTFLIPMVIYWMVRYFNGRPWKLGPYIVGVTLLFLGFNNPYILLISASLIVATVGVILLENVKQLGRGMREALPLILVSCLPLFIVLISIKSLDRVKDRVEAPFGYAVNYAKPESVFLPQLGEMYEKVQPIISYQKTSGEGRAYIGLASVFLLAFILIRWMVQVVKTKGRNWYALTSSQPINRLLWASILILIFSMNFFLYDGLKEMKFLPIIQQFRAPGRFAWVFYYVGSLAAVYTLQEIFSWLKSKEKARMAYSVLLMFVTLFTIDIYYYLNFLTQGFPRENRISEQWQQQYSADLVSVGVNKDTYQAMYILPAIHLWTDKLVYESNYWSEVHAFAISLTTGIPFFNAFLSRMSVSQTLNSAQMVSHPLIDKKFEKVLPDKRPILLVIGGQPKLETGELLLVTHADTVLHNDKYTLLSFDPFNHQQDTFWLNAQRSYHDLISSSQYQPIRQQSFEQDVSNLTFYGNGAKTLSPEDRLIFEYALPDNFDYTQTYEFSIWVNVDHKHSSLPFIHITELEEDDTFLKTSSKWTCRAKDIQDGWLRVAQEIELNEKTKKIRVESYYDFEAIVDEFQMRDIRDTTFAELPNTQDFLYNNFKIKKNTHD